MDKNFLIQLTQNLYRLTLLFPKKEPLKYKMRELADDILTDFLRTHNLSQCNVTFPRYINSGREKLEVLDGFFEVAKSQNWVSQKEILNLQQEYSKLKDELGKLSQVRPVSVPSQVRPVKANQSQTLASSMKERQEKILDFLKENGRAQVGQLKEIFPEVTKRTLRRDFEFLLKQGKIERMGERNETFYQLKGRT